MELLLEADDFYSVRTAIDSVFARSLLLSLTNCQQEIKLNEWDTELISIFASPTGYVSLFVRGRKISYCYNSSFDATVIANQLALIFEF